MTGISILNAADDGNNGIRRSCLFTTPHCVCAQLFVADFKNMVIDLFLLSRGFAKISHAPVFVDFFILHLFRLNTVIQLL